MSTTIDVEGLAEERAEPVDPSRSATSPGDHGGGLVESFVQFDLASSLGRSLTRASGVAGPWDTGPGAGNAGMVLDACTILIRRPWKLFQDRVLRWFVTAVLVFSTAVAALLITGHLGDVYRRIYEFWPGRPWTHVMRDHPWIYAVLAVALSVLPFWLAPRDRWGRSFLIYVVFLVGFLGGHVFWGGGSVTL